MSLQVLKQRLFRAADKFAEIIHPVYVKTNHTILTQRGIDIPTQTEVADVINRLINDIKEGDTSASSGGIQIEIDRDEDDVILDGSIGYVMSLYTLLDENDVNDN
jgi:hypothetical protein